MPRPRIFGFFAIVIAFILTGLFVYSLTVVSGERISAGQVDLNSLSSYTYYAIAAPIVLITMAVLGTGLWIGWTILTIKVVPPMPEIVEKKDFSKIKAFFLCIVTLALGALFIYGLYIRNFWALAVPAALITLVILGAVFWVGIAIITTRSTLPEEKQQS
jgi:uncharacterized protein with PQ loop repeat